MFDGEGVGEGLLLPPLWHPEKNSDKTQQKANVFKRLLFMCVCSVGRDNRPISKPRAIPFSTNTGGRLLADDIYIKLEALQRRKDKCGRMLRGFFLGVVLVLVVIAGGGYVAVKNGVMPANADATPSTLEKWAARSSLHATLKREAPKGPNPLAVTDENMLAGVKIYAEDCAVCHGDKSKKATDIAAGLYQKPPQLADKGVEDDPEGVTFWRVKHGIRLTGMPSYARDLSDKQIWQVSMFLKHMDKLSPAAEKAWSKVHVNGKERKQT